MTATPRVLRVFAVALLLLGAVRLAAVVLHVPLAAYANQYDMARTSACLSLWPAVAPQALDQATRAAPLPDYVRLPAVGGDCYRSTAVAVAWLALQLDGVAEALGWGEPDGFALRQLGVLQGLLWLVLAATVHRTLRAHPHWQLGHALFFALVLSDPFNSLYFATLYTEPAAVLALYAGAALLLQLALGLAPGAPFLLAFAVALLALGLSRVQHLLLPLWLALLALPWLRDRGRAARASVWLLPALALAVVALQLRAQSDGTGIAAANRSNSVTGALLPAAADPQAMTRRLGLPARCALLEHANWYMPQGHDVEKACPELAAMPAWRPLWAMLAEPRAAAVLVGRGVAQTGAWRLPYVGEVAGTQFQRLAQPSLADPLRHASFHAHVVLWLSPLLFALWRSLRSWHLRELTPADLLLVLAAGVVLIGWATALLGDGYAELSRHLHLAQNAVLLAWAILLAQLLGWASAGAASARTGSTWPARAPAMLAPAVALLVSLAWIRLPLAEGLIDSAAREGTQLRVAGWVLDPSGSQAVELRTDGQRFVVPTVVAADVHAMYPLRTDGAAAAARFDVRVPVPARAERLWLWSIGRYGQHTDTDAVVLHPATGGAAAAEAGR